jgi:hypothetical protein
LPYLRDFSARQYHITEPEAGIEWHSTADPYKIIQFLLLRTLVFLEIDLILELQMELLRPMLFEFVDGTKDARNIFKHVGYGNLVWKKSRREGRGRVVSKLITIPLVVRFVRFYIEEALGPAVKRAP